MNLKTPGVGKPCAALYSSTILLYIFAPSRSPFPLRHKFMSGPPFARPRGPTPKSHPRWNEQLGQWENAAGQPRPEATRNERRVEQRAESGRQARSAASHVANAAGQQQRRRAFVNRRRESGHNLARCNSTLFTCEGGATLELCQETSANFGVLGDATCAHCSALLFDAEGVAIPGRRGEVRGRSCCSNGDVVLPPVRELPVLRDMWRGEAGASRTLQKFARKLNNALALASEKVGRVPAPGTVALSLLPTRPFHTSRSFSTVCAQIVPALYNP